LKVNTLTTVLLRSNNSLESNSDEDTSIVELDSTSFEDSELTVDDSFEGTGSSSSEEIGVLSLLESPMLSILLLEFTTGSISVLSDEPTELLLSFEVLDSFVGSSSSDEVSTIEL